MTKHEGTHLNGAPRSTARYQSMRPCMTRSSSGSRRKRCSSTICSALTGRKGCVSTARRASFTLRRNNGRTSDCDLVLQILGFLRPRVDALHHIESIRHAPERRKALPIRVARAAEIQHRLVAQADKERVV